MKTSRSRTPFQGESDFFHFSPSTLSNLRHKYGISYSWQFHPVTTSGVFSHHHVWKSSSIACSVQNVRYSVPLGMNSLVPHVITFLDMMSLIVIHSISSAHASTEGNPLSHATSISIAYIFITSISNSTVLGNFCAMNWYANLSYPWTSSPSTFLYLSMNPLASRAPSNFFGCAYLPSSVFQLDFLDCSLGTKYRVGRDFSRYWTCLPSSYPR